MEHSIQGMQLRHHPLIGLAMASGCLIGAVMLCVNVSGCDSEEKGSKSSQPNPGSKKTNNFSVEKGPQDALLLAQRAHGLFIKVVGPNAVPLYFGTVYDGGVDGTRWHKSYWVWSVEWRSVGRSIYFQLIPAWSKDKLFPGKDVGLERIGPFRWRTHRIAVFGDPNDAFFGKVQKELLRRTQKVQGAISRQDERHQSEEGTDTLLLAQRISRQFDMAMPIGGPFVYGMKGKSLGVGTTNYGFQIGSETKHFLPAGDYFPRIAPEGDKPVWLWRAWDSDDGTKFLLIEVLPDGKRVQHAGVMQEIRDYGPCTVHEYTWEGHGIRVYAWEDHEWVDGVMPSFHKYFSASEEGDEVAPG